MQHASGVPRPAGTVSRWRRRARAALALSACAAACVARPPQPAEVGRTAGDPAAPLAWTRHVVTTGYQAMTAVAADFTGDGRLDVISADFQGGGVYLHPAPTFAAVTLAREPNPIHAQVADVDGDGDPDFVGARFEPGLVFWLERPARPLEEPWALRVIDEKARDGANGVHGLWVGDLDADGKLDVLATSNVPEGPQADSILWYRQPPNVRGGDPWPRTPIAGKDAPGRNHYVGVGDVDGDGRLDVATGAKFGHYFAWWRQPGEAAARLEPWPKTVLATPQEGATHVWIGDLTGDGRPDLLGARGHGRGFALFEGPTHAAREVDATFDSPHSLAVADADGDGDPDLASCGSPVGSTCAWFENRGQGRFVRHVIARDQAAYDVHFVDMDGDGDLDLLVAGAGSRNVVWFEARPARR